MAGGTICEALEGEGSERERWTSERREGKKDGWLEGARMGGGRRFYFHLVIIFCTCYLILMLMLMITFERVMKEVFSLHPQQHPQQHPLTVIGFYLLLSRASFFL